MRILHINKFLYPFGGAESYMFGLADAQKENGNQVKFWGMSSPKNTIQDEYDCFAPEIDYSEIKGLTKYTAAWSTVYSSENKKRISKLLDKFTPEIAHIHNYNFQLTPSILKELKRRDIKVVHTVHDSQLVCPWHRLYNFQQDRTCTKCVEGSFINCISDRCFDGSLGKSVLGALESIYYHQKDYYNKYIDLIISPSQFLANLVKKRVDVDIQVVPNFSNIPLSQLEPGIKVEDHILYFGRVSKEKGIVDIHSIFKDLKIPLKIVGSGPDKDRIEESDYVQYLGPKYGLDLFREIQKAKYVIQPSKWFENCPMTVLESMACGTPLIVSNHSGFVELVENGENGYLVDFTNLPETKTKIADLWENYDVLMREKCSSRFLQLYNKESHIKNINSLYKQLLN